MKRYLTTLFMILSGVILIIGLQIDFRWNGIVSWGLSFISLIFAVYFTKYIPNEKNQKSKN
ncbi:hypothetical protein CFK37_03350 [Virgibacillus phasianinus]|uniref:Uncharacterized protein n=1 Tax=Virgibacillus phasianinus TaxID=2017483 RepID=A0A220U063_9BACI|nr:hypothetical protein [Virgibacillus phasianinus]ASK61283.1 hypothetical protein CFK37_03350 [Virgibacillus phasianinus]